RRKLLPIVPPHLDRRLGWPVLFGDLLARSVEHDQPFTSAKIDLYPAAGDPSTAFLHSCHKVLLRHRSFSLWRGLLTHLSAYKPRGGVAATVLLRSSIHRTVIADG